LTPQQKAIHDYWAAKESQAKGEFTKEHGMENLPPEVKAQIQQYAVALTPPFIHGFSCPSVEKIQEIYDNQGDGKHPLTDQGVHFEVIIDKKAKDNIDSIAPVKIDTKDDVLGKISFRKVAFSSRLDFSRYQFMECLYGIPLGQNRENTVYVSVDLNQLH